MKQVYRYATDGVYVEPIRLKDDDDIPDDCTELAPPDGLYKAKFENGQWVESLSQTEIDAIKNAPQPKSEIDILKENQALMQQAIDDIILGGAL